MPASMNEEFRDPTAAPHPQAGRLRVHPCTHVADDPDIPAGSWDVNLYDFYGAPVTISEFPTFSEAQSFAHSGDALEHWGEYLTPFREALALPLPD